MTAEDVPAVADLYLLAYAADWSREGAVRYVDKFFRFEPASCRVVVEPSGAISGVILAYSFEKESGVTLFIQELFVHPDFRKHGYGKRLVAVLREGTSTRSVKIKPLVKADTSVLNFYNSLGFERDKSVSFSFDE